MSAGYGITNVLAGLAGTAFTWSSGYTTNRDRLNDGKQDELALGSSTPQASGQTLIIDLGSAQSLSAIALLNHNLGTGACTVRVDADTANTFATAVTAKAATTINTAAPYQKDTVLQFPAVSRRYWRLTFTHTGTKTVSIGELLFLAAPTVLSRTPTWGSGETERFITNRVETMTGNLRSTFVSGPIRTKDLPFVDLVGNSQRDEMMSMWRATLGGTLNLLWLDLIESTAIAATPDSQKCLWGKLQESLGWTEGDFQLFGLDGLVLVGQGREVGS